MVVGLAFSGKSCIVKVLKDAMTSIADEKTAAGEDPKPYAKVNMFTMNPKSILKTQLYGNLDESTNEWTDDS